MFARKGQKKWTNKESHLEHLFAAWTSANPSYRNLHLLLDELDVVLGVSRQVFKAGDFGDVFTPAWEIGVNWSAAGKHVHVRGERANKLLTIEFVVSRNTQSLDARKHVKLGQVERAEAVDLV